MTPAINYSRKLEQLPHYEGGMDLERARKLYETDEVIKLASNESPWGPHPAVLEKVAEAAANANRYPDPEATLLRKRLGERHGVDPGRITPANGSCEILLAAASATFSSTAGCGPHGDSFEASLITSVVS